MTQTRQDCGVADLSGAEALLLETLGIPLLAFVLNESADAVAARLESGTQLSVEHEAILAELVLALGRIPRTDPFSLRLSLSVLGEHNPDLGSSWATWAHTQAGGTLDLPDASDDLTAALVAMLRDVYPLFLLPWGDEPFGLRSVEIGGPLFRHPERERFEAAVMFDSSLSQLFPEEDETSGRHGTIHRSTGSGGGVQLAMLAQSVLRNGWEFAAFRHASPTMRQHAEGVLEVLGLAHDAIDGKQVFIPAIVGVAGLRLAGNQGLDLPWGQLRVVTPADETRIPPGLAGKLTTSTSEGRQVEIDYAGDLVMDLEVPYEVALGEPVEGGDWPVPLTSSELVERHLETLRLSLLLAWECGDPRPVIVGTWRSYLDPYRTGAGCPGVIRGDYLRSFQRSCRTRKRLRGRSGSNELTAGASPASISRSAARSLPRPNALIPRMPLSTRSLRGRTWLVRAKVSRRCGSARHWRGS